MPQYLKITDSNTTFQTVSTNVLIDGNLEVTGDVASESSLSDERLKTVIKTIDDGLETILNLDPIVFEWNEKAKEKFRVTDKEEIGLKAQQFLDTYPQLTTLRKDQEHYTLQYDRVVVLLVSAIKQLNEKIKQLESK